MLFLELLMYAVLLPVVAGGTLALIFMQKGKHWSEQNRRPKHSRRWE